MAEQILHHRHLIVLALGQLDDRRRIARVQIDDVVGNAGMAQGQLDRNAKRAVRVLIETKAGGRIHVDPRRRGMQAGAERIEAILTGKHEIMNYQGLDPDSKMPFS